jgi:hypothetical protein
MKVLADDPCGDGRVVTRLLESPEEFDDREDLGNWPGCPYQTLVVGGHFDGDRWYSESEPEARRFHRDIRALYQD